MSVRAGNEKMGPDVHNTVQLLRTMSSMSVAISIVVVARFVSTPGSSSTKIIVADLNSGVDDVSRDATSIDTFAGGIRVTQRQIPLIDAVETPSHVTRVHHCILLDVLHVSTLRQGDGVGLIKLCGETLEG